MLRAEDLRLVESLTALLRNTMDWGSYLCRGVGGELETRPYFDESMYAKGVNAPFINIAQLPAQKVVEDYTGRFENEGRDIARAADDIIETLKNEAGLSSGSVVVDYGSGTGLFLSRLSSAVGSSGTVLATEISDAFRRRLIERSNGMENVRVIHSSDARDPKLQGFEGKIDVAFLCDVYHHIEFPLTICRHLRRSLKPGSGRLFLIDFHRDQGIHTSHPEDPEWILKHVRGDQTTFRREIESCGFELISSPPCPFIPENYIMIFKAVDDAKWQTVGTGWGTSRR